MSIENSFCRCHWEETVALWREASSEDEFAGLFFESPSTEEIFFPEHLARHLIDWELLEDLSDWCRDRTFAPSADWDHFRESWRRLGLLEVDAYRFAPVNRLTDEEEAEIVYGAMPPESVGEIRASLGAIDGAALDDFLLRHQLYSLVPFSELVAVLHAELDPAKGLVVFIG